MKCAKCDQEIDIGKAILASPFSWPLRQTIWHECSNCENGIHLRFEKGKVQIIKTGGSPGYEYEVLEEKIDSSIEFKVDPEYFHIWFKGNHHEIKER